MITPLNLSKGDVVDGVVAKANERGVLLAGEDVWINVSKYADPRLVLPKPGERCRLHIDGQGFIRSIDSLSPTVRIPESGSGFLSHGPQVRQMEDEHRVTYATNSSPTEPDKDVQTRRMNALATATAILSSGGRTCEPDDVLALAAKLEAWVNR